MKTLKLTWEYEGKYYPVFVTYKIQRNIYFRLKKDGFHVSAPSLTSNAKILSCMDKFGPKLLKKFSQSNSNYSFENDYVYLLGEKISLSQLNIKNIDELNIFLKKKALDIVSNLVRKYEKIMKISNPYKIRVRNTSTRLGSNSLKTHSLSFQIALVHYSEEIISTVVVHELAHEFHRNHQQKFYNCVQFYCPNYFELQKKLKKGIHK